MSKNDPRPVELLAPARDTDVAIVAIDHGADAVYIGAPSHGARSAARNSLQDIARAVDYAHRFDARIYCTVNTLVYDDELKSVEALIGDLYRIGVDALIVQDLGVLRMDIPPIALHASTQCDTRDAAKAKFLMDAGFSQIVLARELTLAEISHIRHAVDVPLEAFVHGALCVCYSGDCQASFALNRRSANRGECAQICRLPYRLVDAAGNEIPTKSGKHLLSLRDMNRSQYIGEMLQAGVSSFKIEGRLKDAQYVKNVVAAYRNILDGIIEANPEKYSKSSLGRCEHSFTPDLSKSFNRGYTDYFLNDRRPKDSIASHGSPKSIGSPVGAVKASVGNHFTARLTAELHNGDGLGFYDKNGDFVGFRLNKSENGRLFPASPLQIPPGSKLFRNRDKQWDDLMSGKTAKRQIDLAITLRMAADRCAVADAKTIEGDIGISVSIPIDPIKANSPQTDARLRVMSKLGDTPYRVAAFDDKIGELFIPASIMTALKRKMIDSLNRAISLNHHFDYRREEVIDARLPHGDKLTYHDNVSNRLAKRFYADHGANVIDDALEVAAVDRTKSYRVMTTRYCLRRELGCCLLTAYGSKLPKELFIINGNTRLQLKFNCDKCEMQVLTTPS